MSVTITRRYSFEAAHFLPKVRDDHKCKRMHGHNYEIEVKVSGRLEEDGFIIDFWSLDDVVNPIIAQVDHRVLNEVEGLENPTAEFIGIWFFQMIAHALQEVGGHLAKIENIRVYETKDCWADASRAPDLYRFSNNNPQG